jgi:hypothetical protein
MKKRIKLTIGLLIVVLIAAYFLRSGETVTNDDFAKYLTSQGVSMAGTEWCPHCKAQKQLFGDSFKYVDYHDCDLDGQWCVDHGIEGYPTWVFPDGNYPGVKTTAQLKEMSGYE